MDFLSVLEAHGRAIADVVYQSLLGTPPVLSGREYRTLTDHPTRRLLCLKFPELFRELRDDRADLVLLSDDSRLSLKKQKTVFSKPYKNGKRWTVPSSLAVVNTLSESGNLILGFNWLWAYQPAIPGSQKFTMAAMSVEKVRLLARKKPGKGQWVIKPASGDWDYLRSFDFNYVIPDPGTLSNIFLRGADRIWDDCMAVVWAFNPGLAA